MSFHPYIVAPSLDEERITIEQINAMRSETFSGAFPRPVGMRADGTLIVDLPYTTREGAYAQGYAAISPLGGIMADHVYDFRRRAFVEASI